MFPFLLLAIAIIIILVLSIIEQEAIIILRAIIATIFGFLILAAVSSTIGEALPADEVVSVKKVEKMDVSADAYLILDNGERRFFAEGVTLCPDDSNTCITVVKRRNSNPVIRFFFWTDREEVSTERVDSLRIPPS